MTAPTPAQIEAATKAVARELSMGGSDDETVAYAALTAAAEVGDDKYFKTIMGEYEKPAAEVVRPEYEYVEGQAVAISAGPAEVGEPEDWIKKRAGIRNSAIERCAQVVEHETKSGYRSTKAIAAAIRVLKERPNISDAFGGPFPEEEP